MSVRRYSARRRTPRTYRRKRFKPNGYTRKVGNYRRYVNVPKGMTPEVKFKDTTTDDAVISATGTVQGTGSQNLVVQAAGASERIGRRIMATGIGWRGELCLPALDAVGAAPDGDVIRLIMFVDKQANGAAATTGAILSSSDYQAFNNLNNTNRFRTLCDKTIACNYKAACGSGGAADNDYAAVNIPFSFFTKLSFPIEFSGATGAITEIKSNNIGILAISKNAEAQMFSVTRFRYTDA